MGVEWQSEPPVHGFKGACNSLTSKVLYNIIIEFGVPMKSDRLKGILLSKMI
jgi:hypothetical protein